MKDPAFLFYPGDWLGGTLGMTLEEKGAYIELLILQFNTGKFKEAYAKRMLGSRFTELWEVLKNKFKTDGNVFWSERLMLEIEKRKAFCLSRRNSALGIKTKKEKDKSVCKAYAKHTEDENENEIKKEIELEFVLPEFKETFEKWLKYKSDRKEKYKSTESIKQCFNKLIKLSENNPATALEIVNQSMANNWAGLFELKKEIKENKNKFSPIPTPKVLAINIKEKTEEEKRWEENYKKHYKIQT